MANKYHPSFTPEKQILYHLEQISFLSGDVIQIFDQRFVFQTYPVIVIKWHKQTSENLSDVSDHKWRN